MVSCHDTSACWNFEEEKNTEQNVNRFSGTLFLFKVTNSVKTKYDVKLKS